MDKLKPILAQKFWILFSLVLIMPLVGYFMTKGKLAAEIEDRWKKLDGSFSGIPAGTGVPNDSWTNKLNEINNQQILHNRRANQELWLKQKERMFWPKDIAPIMAKAEYFKDLTEQQKGDQVLYKYPLGYESQLRALWEIVDPLDDGVNLRDSDKRRKVAFAMADLHQSASVKPGTLPPTFAEIWGAQEDIWLQTELLNAIKRLNANAISQGDAFVKQLGKIQLFGGAKSTGDAGAATGSPMTSGGAPAGGDMTAMMGAFGGGSRTEATALSADINLAEEFTVSMEAGGGGNPAAAMGSFGASSGGSAEVAGGGGAAGAAKTEIKRYIDLDEKQPYKRRGFYIKVTMDHRKVPDLIAELMNSPFPVEIIRVQQVWLSDTGSNTTGGSGPMAGAAPGFSGFRAPSSGDAGTSLATPTSAGFPDAAADTTGFAASGSGGASGRSASSNPGSIAALADPNLAQVAILGVWTLYLPPPPAADGGQAAPPNTATPTPGLAATSGNATAPVESSDAAVTDAKPTTESADGTGDEAKKSDEPNAPKPEPAKPEKAESESDTPAPEKAPPKDDAADSTDSKNN